jgi:myosin-5
MQNSNVRAVYIQDDVYSWLPARVIQEVPGTSKVQVQVTLPQKWKEQTVLSPDSNILDLEEGTTETLLRTVNLADYPHGELPLQNLDERGKLLGKRDMADLPFLHEAAILYNLKERHASRHPYTRVGDIMVAMNPFTWIEGLYSPETRDMYAKELLWNEEEEDDDEEDAFAHYEKLGYDPHVYETSCLAYRGLVHDGHHQSILVTGESGAGKTETIKIVMSHLATLQEGDNQSVITRVLESNPVFEAFGNARTLRNDNSSRFGKFTQLQFDWRSERSPLAGSVCQTYLLEKSRVVQHSEGERNYHIFYQLLSAPNDFKKSIWKHLDGTTLESFLSLGSNSEYQLLGPGVDEAEWLHTLEALKVFEFTGDRLKSLLQALCCVLQLGNMTFIEDPDSKQDQEGGTVVASNEELQKLQDIMGIPVQDLEEAMTTRNLRTGHDNVKVRLRPDVAKDSADALAKEVYARIFDVLLQSINDYTRGKLSKEHSPLTLTRSRSRDSVSDDGLEDTFEGEYGIICLLDIFGFERFEVNRFEQLCINYANEHLQFKYVLDNFREVQEEYESEGIDLFDFSLVDNSQVLALLENKLGIIIALNEECVRPKGNDESFVYKIKIVNKDNDRMIDKKLHRKTEFGIRHFAGPVTYEAHKFVERNTDKLPDDLLHCAAKSANELIRKEFARIVENSVAANSDKPGRRKPTAKTVLQKFRLQLRHLMNSIQDTTTRYIRCIKPNDNMIPEITDHYTTMRQLECAGLVTAITISRETFPNRLDYASTRQRFDCLLKSPGRLHMKDVPDKDAVQYMMSNLLSSMVEQQPNGKVKVPFACGNTRVYFRAGSLEYLETKRLEFYTKRVVVIQNWFRMLKLQRIFIALREAAVRIQCMERCRQEYQRYQEKKKACVVLETWVRGLQASALVQGLREAKAATLLESAWRCRTKSRQFQKFKVAAIIVQGTFRAKIQRKKLAARLTVCVEEARMDSKLGQLQEQVSGLQQDAFAPSSQRREGALAGRAVNEDLLQEVESMFDYLRKEIFELRSKNSELKEQLHETEKEYRELAAHAESVQATATASRLQVAKLMKSNQVLNNEVTEHRQSMLMLKKELKSIGSERNEEVASVKVDYENILEQKQAEIQELKAMLTKTQQKHEVEKKHLIEHAAKAEEGLMTQILRLKDDLRRTQESHHDYLAKLMDVLETTHQTREQETARISAELLSVKEEKDAQIDALQRELGILRKSKNSFGLVASTTPTARTESKVTEVTVLRRELERNGSARQQRSQKFIEVSNRLMAAVSPDNLVAITSARRSRGKKISVVEEETIRMKKMIRFLGDLYNLEETSQAKVDQDLLRTMDSYLAALEPNAALEELEVRFKRVVEENKLLKEQLSFQGKCPRCDARDKRRMNRVRSNRSPTRPDIVVSTPPDISADELTLGYEK